MFLIYFPSSKDLPEAVVLVLQDAFEYIMPWT